MRLGSECRGDQARFSRLRAGRLPRRRAPGSFRSPGRTHGEHCNRLLQALPAYGTRGEALPRRRPEWWHEHAQHLCTRLQGQRRTSCHDPQFGGRWARSYTLWLDNGKIEGECAIDLNGGLGVQHKDTISNQTTQLPALSAKGSLVLKYSCGLAQTKAEEPPKLEGFTKSR